MTNRLESGLKPQREITRHAEVLMLPPRPKRQITESGLAETAAREIQHVNGGYIIEGGKRRKEPRIIR